MAKYKMKALTILIGGKVFEKSENPVFDSEAQPQLAAAFEQAEKAGFLELIPEPAPEPEAEKAGKKTKK